MNLYEEYAKRHGLRFPLIKRPDKDSRSMYLLYEADKRRWERSWVVFHAQYRHDPHKPPYFVLDWLVPSHNSLSSALFNSRNPSCLTSISQPKSVQWEEYELEILCLAKRNDGINPVARLSDAKLTTWEMFLYCADSSLSSLPNDVSYEIYRSLDPEVGIETRMQSQQVVIDFLHSSRSKLLSKWSTFSQYCDPSSYASWLAEVVHNMRDENYQNDFADMYALA